MASKKSQPSGKRVQQNGGTFLGVVLGLIVGLAIAVVVALYINRSPTPFVSRGPAPGSDAAAGNNIDPNRPLAGNTPSQAVPSSAQPAPPNNAPGQPSNPSTGLLDEPRIVEVAPSEPASDVGTPPDASAPQAQTGPHWPSSARNNSTNTGTANGTSAGKPAVPGSSAAAETKTVYILQAGAYRTEADADQQRANLALQGLNTYVSQGKSGAVTYYRVRTRPYATLDAMNADRQRLASQGIDTIAIRATTSK